MNAKFAPVPTFAVDLLELRQNGKRPLGGVVLADTWTAIEQARRMDLFPIYLRARDDWSAYDLSAVEGLDVHLHLAEPDKSRVDSLVAHVSTFNPGSLRLTNGEQHDVIAGKKRALAELLRWWMARYRNSKQPNSEVAECL